MKASSSSQEKKTTCFLVRETSSRRENSVRTVGGAALCDPTFHFSSQSVQQRLLNTSTLHFVYPWLLSWTSNVEIHLYIDPVLMLALWVTVHLTKGILQEEASCNGKVGIAESVPHYCHELKVFVKDGTDGWALYCPRVRAMKDLECSEQIWWHLLLICQHQQMLRYMHF